jgi:NAD+ synthase (glutamine-hydrolysing)
MKIAIAQIEIIPGRPDKNFKKIKEYVVEALLQKVDIIVFPELCLSGYLIGDTWEESAFIRDCEDYNDEVRELADGIDIVFGSIAADWGRTHTDGRHRLYNVAYYAKNATFLEWHGLPYYIKTLLPNYREFEEPRHFTSSLELFSNNSYCWAGCQGSYFTPKKIEGANIAISICEDFWVGTKESENTYKVDPSKEFLNNGADLFINVSCSPYTIGKNNSRNRIFGEGHAKGKGVPVIYVNAVGIQNNGKNIYTFDGSSVVYDENGDIIAQAPMFKEHMMYVEWNNVTKKILPGEMCDLPGSDIAEVAESLKYGIGKYLDACGTKRVVIGASGGIDSCVAASLYAQVIGPENLLLVNMPSKYNSDTTINIAKELAENIECYYTSIPIEESVNLTNKQIEGLEVCRFKRMPEGWGFPGGFKPMALPVFSSEALWEKKKLTLTSTHMENIQARDRSSRILSALSCAWGGVFTCNGNKDEITVGYATLYGDIAGFLAVLGDLRKPMVYELGEYLNKAYPVIPKEAFTIVASAELSAEQNVDEGMGDPIIYWYHSKLFYTWVESWHRKTPEDNLKWYMDGKINKELGIPEDKDVYKLFPSVKAFTDDIERWYKLFKGMAVAKRVQAPPILSVSRRSFGFDYRESLNCWYLTRGYYRMKEQALKNEQ